MPHAGPDGLGAGGRSSLLNLLIQMLISSRNTLHGHPEMTCEQLAVWAFFSLVQLTLSINHHTCNVTRELIKTSPSLQALETSGIRFPKPTVWKQGVWGGNSELNEN